MYTTLSNKDRDSLLSKSHKEGYKMKGHSFILLKGVGRQYCKSCGLMALKNKATQWCIEKGCNYEDHKDHKKTMARLTKNAGQ